MNEILVRFVRGAGWDSRAIEWRTAAWCSHVEAVLPGSRTLGAMLIGGVRVRNFTDRCYRDVERAEIWSVPCTEVQQAAFYSFLYSQVGKPYDWRAIVQLIAWRGQQPGRKWKEPDCWFCSELQPAAMNHADVWSIPDELPGNCIVPVVNYGMVAVTDGARLAA